MKQLGLFACLVLFCVTGVSSTLAKQEPKPEVFTEMERAKVDIINLKAQLVDLLRRNSDLQASYGNCQSQLGPLQQKENIETIQKSIATTKQEVEKAHPGWTYDPASGQLMALEPEKKPESPGRGAGAGPKAGGRGR